MTHRLTPIKSEYLPVLSENMTLSCAGNRQKVDETDSEEDDVENGNEDYDSDEGIEEGQ